MKHNVYQTLMSIGTFSGCHQMPERSFFLKSKQFPVCARCTGVLFGNITAVALFFVITPSLDICLTGCLVMFADWLIQRIGIRESTNIRRLVTGIIGGYSLTTVYFLAVRFVIYQIIEML